MKPDQLQKNFVHCYDAEADAIFRFCLVRVSNGEQAIDLTQETFTHLWQAMKRGEKIKNEKAFLFTIAHRLIIDWYRKKKAISIESDDDSDKKEGIDFMYCENFLDLEMRAEARYLLDKLKQISQPNRQAVYLRFVEGLSPPEIGHILGISTDAASVRIYRGLSELKNITKYNKINLIS